MTTRPFKPTSARWWRPIAAVATAMLLATSLPAWSQDGAEAEPATLVADRIIFANESGMLQASGKVEIFFGGVKMVASSLIYSRTDDRITVEGPLTITQPDGTVFIADYAELSTDLRDGILHSARLVLSQQVQIAAAEMERSEGRYTRLYKTVTSSCRVCPTAKPVWQIRAREIVHDSEAHKLYFSRAQLRVLGVPVFYIPRMALPDPSVTRARGFLTPSYRSNSTLGTGVRIPYFIPLGDHADLTVAPYFYSGGSKTIELLGRKRWHNASLDVDSALTRDSLTAATFRGYLFADGEMDLPYGYSADLQVQLTSDKTYMSQYGFAAPDRLENTLNVTGQTRDRFALAEVGAYYSTRSGDINAQLPSQTVDVTLRGRKPVGNAAWAGLGLDAASYYRPSTSNGSTGRDGIRASASGDWSTRGVIGPGFVLTSRALVRAEAFRTYDDTTYASLVTRTFAGMSAGLSYPMARHSDRGVQTTLVPMAQLVFTPNVALSTPNEDSTFAELDTTNLFELDRLGGIDAVERGLRLNLGVAYQRQSQSGNQLGLSFGRVIRATADTQFSQASGLAGVTSDFVLGLRLARRDRFAFHSRLVFDDDLSVSRNETRLSVTGRRLELGGSYLWKEADATLGSSTARSGVTADMTYGLTGNWNAVAQWQHDFVAGRSTKSKIGMIYQNECISVDFSVTRQFNSSTSATPTNSVGLTVALAGFGSQGDGPAYNRRCSQ